MSKAILKNSKIMNLSLVDDSIYDLPTSFKTDLIDSEGYIYYLSSDNLKCLINRNGKPSAFFNNNPYTFKNIETYFKKNDLNIAILNDDVTSATKDIKFKCNIHDIEFDKTWNEIKNGSHCPLCGRDRYHNKRANSIDYIKSEALVRFDIVVVSENYTNNEEKLMFICNKHKDLGVQFKSWGNIISKPIPCLYCSKENLLENSVKSHGDFENEVKSIHGDKYTLLTKYVRAKEKIEVMCNECNESFSMRPDHLLAGHGCWRCTKSKGEEAIIKHLSDKNINFIREYRFDDCVGLCKKLPYDFYLPDYNLCIEYQGIQHFEPIEIFGGESAFNKQKINDEIKRVYCKTNSIKLLEIPYWDFDDIENIICVTLERVV